MLYASIALDYELTSRGGQPGACRLPDGAVGETLNRAEGETHQGDSFFTKQSGRMLEMAIEPLQAGTASCRRSICSGSSPGRRRRPEQLATPQWRAGFHNRMLEAAYHAGKSSRPRKQISSGYSITGWAKYPYSTTARVRRSRRRYRAFCMYCRAALSANCWDGHERDAGSNRCWQMDSDRHATVPLRGFGSNGQRHVASGHAAAHPPASRRRREQSHRAVDR